MRGMPLQTRLAMPKDVIRAGPTSLSLFRDHHRLLTASSWSTARPIPRVMYLIWWHMALLSWSKRMDKWLRFGMPRHRRSMVFMSLVGMHQMLANLTKRSPLHSRKLLRQTQAPGISESLNGIWTTGCTLEGYPQRPSFLTMYPLRVGELSSNGWWFETNFQFWSRWISLKSI